MTSNSEIERIAIKEEQLMGIYRQPVFRCPQCGGKSDR